MTDQLDELPLIDIKLGAKLAGGSEGMAKELMDMLQDALATHAEELKTAFEKKDLEALRQAAHKLHGACCYTGTPRLKAAAKTVEVATKNAKENIDAAYEHLQAVITLTGNAMASAED